MPVEQLETVSVVHKTSRAGDPHRHIHFQIGTHVWAAGAWRGLDTAALFKQQGAVRALGTAAIAAHPQLAAVLDLHGLTLDPVTGEVAELEPFNARMSKRGEQVTKNLARMQAEWKAAHPGQEPGPVVASRLMALAWCHERPNKKPSSLKDEAGWRTELERVGYAPNLPRVHRRPPASLDDLRVQEVAGRALNRCAGTASTWTRHTVQEHVTHVTTEAGVRAAPEALREFITLTTMLAAQDCLSVLPPGRVHPNHVAHLTSLHVVTVETELRDLLQARVSHQEPDLPDVSRLGREHDLDLGQTRAAVAVASTDPLVVVEGAAGAGKTTMLGAAIEAATGEGRSIRIVTPTEQSSGRKHQRTVTLSADYVAEHTHLSYASTAYGVKGTTVQESHTLLGGALSAAGVYVGMTRGRAMNQLHIVAADLDEARDQFTAALDRDPADRGLTEASRAAEAAVRGLTDDGPAKLVNRERARLAAQIEHADRQVQTWEQAAAALDRQLQTQRAEPGGTAGGRRRRARACRTGEHGYHCSAHRPGDRRRHLIHSPCRLGCGEPRQPPAGREGSGDAPRNASWPGPPRSTVPWRPWCASVGATCPCRGPTCTCGRKPPPRHRPMPTRRSSRPFKRSNARAPSRRN